MWRKCCVEVLWPAAGSHCSGLKSITWLMAVWPSDVYLSSIWDTLGAHHLVGSVDRISDDHILMLRPVTRYNSPITTIIFMPFQNKIVETSCDLIIQWICMCWIYLDISACSDVIAVTLALHGWGTWTSISNWWNTEMWLTDERREVWSSYSVRSLDRISNLHLKRFLVTNCYFRILALIFTPSESAIRLYI